MMVTPTEEHTMRIYHRQRAGRPIRVVWAFEEAGAPYDLTIMTPDEGKSDEHRARHPLGRVPVLEDAEGAVFESSALCLQIGDLHPESGLVPAVGTRDRALVYQWAFFAMTEVEPPAVEHYRLRESAPEAAEAASARVAAGAAAIGDALAGGDFLVGGRLTVADIVASEVVRIASRVGAITPEGSLAGYLAAMEARPARQRAAAALA
jgi:glutathione S-transferase